MWEQEAVNNLGLQPAEEACEPEDGGDVQAEPLAHEVQPTVGIPQTGRQRYVVAQCADVDTEPLRIHVIRQFDHLALGAAELEVADHEHGHG